MTSEPTQKAPASPRTILNDDTEHPNHNMKRIIALLTATIAVACSEPTPPPITGPDIMTQARPVQQDDWVETPAGPYHRSCVYEIEDGAVVMQGDRVRRRNGTIYQLRKCAHPNPPWSHGARRNERGSVPVNNGWMEYAYYDLTLPATYSKLVARWTIPPNPLGLWPAHKVYYTFPGIVNPSYILQPVLQWGNNGAYGGAYWTITAWRCNDGSNCTHSSPLTVPTGHAMYGSVMASSCVSGSCTWTVTTKDETSGVQTVLNINDANNYFSLVGGAVEVYNINSCADYPRDGVYYSEISAFDGSLQQVTPSFHNVLASNPSPSCFFDVSTTGSTVKLYHNPAPPNVTLGFPNGTPSISWQPMERVTSYRVSLYTFSTWNTPEGGFTTSNTSVLGTTTGTSFIDPSRSYTGFWSCHFTYDHYPDPSDEETRDYYYSVDAYYPNGASLQGTVPAPVANEPAADMCYPL